MEFSLPYNAVAIIESAQYACTQINAWFICRLYAAAQQSIMRSKVDIATVFTRATIAFSLPQADPWFIYVTCFIIIKGMM